jgi:hypothetical protein
MKYTGAVVFWSNRRMTVTGTYAQCDTALTAAQQHSLAAGWWSIGSLSWNPTPLSSNNSARNALRLQLRPRVRKLLSPGHQLLLCVLDQVIGGLERMKRVRGEDGV